MKQQPLRSYVVKKYVEATSVAQAIRISNETPVHEVLILEEDEKVQLPEAIGFHETQDEDYEVPDEYSKDMIK